MELSSDKKFFGATPGIIQVLHIWNQKLNYHVYMHCIISGGGLTLSRNMRKVRNHFFILVRVLREKFKGKFLVELQQFYQDECLVFSAFCEKLRNSCHWSEFRNNLYAKDWRPYIKGTFNGFGNAMEYLGRYIHKITISNSQILSVNEQQTTFLVRGKQPGDPYRTITLRNTEFICRYLMQVFLFSPKSVFTVF